MSALYFDARIDGAQLQKDIANINKQIGQISTNMQKEGREIDAITRRIGQGLAGAFSVFAAGNFVKNIANVRGEFQQLEVAFETMLGSKQKADRLMAEVVQFAGRTPFELKDVASGTKQLLAFGIEAGKVIPTLKAMGDVSAGLSVPIERLILNFGQVRTQTKLTGRELRDFQMAGVPVVAELAKNLNTSETAIQDMVTAGKIGFKEVEDAFISMTSEGGQFSNLMEKQAETITGLASNFADAWDKMLNSIGQENEGIITGSIKGAITLVENYEEVIKVLKLLVATYGTYKAAVIATAVVERSAAAAGNIKAWFELARGIRTAKDAQIAFNLATKANPYALIAGAVASLISYLVIFRKETKSVEDQIADLNNSIEGIGKQIEIDRLLGKYVELKDKTNKTEEEQKELNNSIDQLSKIFPGAISGVDKYGRAVDLVKDKLVNLNDELRKNAQLTAERELLETQEALNKKIEERNRLVEEANKKSGERFSFKEWMLEGGSGQKIRGLSDEEIKNNQEEIKILTSDIDKLSETILNLEGKLNIIGQVDAAKALQPYKDLFGEVASYSEEQALKIKEELTKLLFLGLGAEAEAQIKAEIDKIASQLTLPTIQEQIQQVVSDLKSAQSQLNQLRAPGSRATDTQIKDKEDEIKSLQQKYDALTGLNSKEREKQHREEEKSRKERLKTIQEFHNEEISLERQLQASKITLMKEGAERQKAEAELQYQQELDRIAQQQQAYLEAWNASQGFEPGDIGFISELPEQDIERFTQLRVNAEQRKNKQIEQINRDAAREIKSIWQDVNDVFLSESERDIAAINQRYDDLIERAKRAGETDFTSVNDARAAAIEQATVDAGMRQLQFEEEIAMQRAEISTQGFNRDIEIERKKLEIVKEFARKKIDILKKSNTEESKQEIEQLELYIESSNAGLKELNEKTLAQSIGKVNQMVDEFKRFSDEVFGVDSGMSTILGGLGEMGDSFARIASGDYSGAISLLTSLMKIGLDTSVVENRLARPWEEFEQWIAASNRELQRYIALRDEAIGSDRYTATDQAIDELQSKIEETQSKLADMQLSFTLEGSGWFNKANREVADQLKKLQEQLGGVFNEESYKEVGVAFWEKVKAIYSYDLNQLLFDDAGQFTIEKINKLIDEAAITDQKVIDAVTQYEQLLDQLTAAEQQKQELLTATMADNIADGIIDGFSQGYDSVADFADGFEELMKNAILNALKIQTLEDPLKEWYRQFADASESGGVLTAQEIADLENAYNNIVENARQRFDEMQRIANLDFSADIAGREGLKGAIKGITEETARLIAGQFTTMREIGQKSYLTGLEQLDAINQSVTHLARIEENTRYNKHLAEIRDDIKLMNNYLKQIA
ncbi:tape measure protein [Mariniphaga sediminis]|uniref:tape measure protein n=1 Tax=Mariniphaga sediminis TaxID=1628158 RepID=UPI0035622FB2